ncbi:NUDIX hydrolase [Mesorhizobium yinganensis]|uniref:NUDIX hydrolase n=1 Tax=Mesorhizobium yinganensis TaxID=3157707 RepID=UPI0032B837A7
MRDKEKASRSDARSGEAHNASVDLIAVVVAVPNQGPSVLTVGQGSTLPSGPFELGHRSLQSGLRAWVEHQTGQQLGYIEQLYTFADSDRAGADSDRAGERHRQRVISISYLALTRAEHAADEARRAWRRWYDYFPWEDHRSGIPPIISEVLRPRLLAWADNAGLDPLKRERRRRAAFAFGLDGRDWNEELVLQRYELLYEAALIEEAMRGSEATASPPISGTAMTADHRRILATGVARLRSKIKYRPVVFELMPPVFTLLQLQRTVEALSGRLVHKPNFRRLIEQQDLVEETGETTADTVGRPAKLFRFRHAVLDERAVAGTKLPLSRT